MTSSPSAPTRWLALGAAGIVALLAGCSGGSSTGGASGGPRDVVDQGYQSGDGSSRLWATGDRGAPVALTGTDFTGGAQDVTAWRGDVVVLNTWYAACPPCRAVAPALVAFANDYAGRSVHVLGINGTDDAGAADAFARTFAVPYPSLADGDGAAIASLQGSVPIQAVPTTVVLDREGRVAARILGLADASTLRGLVDDILAEGGGAGVSSSSAPSSTAPTSTAPTSTAATP